MANALDWRTVMSDQDRDQDRDPKEDAPLLVTQERSYSSGNAAEDAENALSYGDAPEQETKSTFYLFFLCLGLGGLQMAWATELSYGSPFLLSLGMPKSLLAVVWIAGPLSGVVVQPIVGSLSDNCKIAWGRRRPFILAGGAATVISLLALAWTPDIVTTALSGFYVQRSEDQIANIIIGVAVAWIYILDFSVNTLQASIRAFIVDNASTHQQDQANAWASRIVGFGNIMGYLTGYINLPSIIPFLGDTQFKVLCAISCTTLVATVALSCYTIPEWDPRQRWPSGPADSRNLVCITQFFNWMGWFPFLFYITTYIGQLYLNPLFEQKPHLSRGEINKAWEEATRFGAFALLVFAVISFVANSILPTFVKPIVTSHRARHNLASSSRLSRFFTKFYIPYLTIRRAWFVSHLLFAACMFSTFLLTTAASAVVMTGLVGLSWAMTLWAPFALIGADISKRDALRRARARDNAASPLRSPITDVIATVSSPSTMDAEATAAPVALIAEATEEGGAETDTVQAGVVLGLHNVSISAPQVVATVVSSIIFGIAQRERGVAGDTSVGWVLRFGGIAALVAAWRTLKIREERKKGDQGDVEG